MAEEEKEVAAAGETEEEENACTCVQHVRLPCCCVSSSSGPCWLVFSRVTPFYSNIPDSNVTDGRRTDHRSPMMAQRKKHQMKRRRYNRESEADFQLAAETKDDDSVRINTLRGFTKWWVLRSVCWTYIVLSTRSSVPRAAVDGVGGTVVTRLTTVQEVVGLINSKI